MANQVIYTSGPAGIATSSVARMVNFAGSYITIASTGSIAWRVFDESSSTPNTVIASGSLTVASVVFDTLQTGGVWTKDSTGYNFLNTIAGSALVLDGHRYRIEYLFTPASGPAFTLIHFHTAETWRSS